MRYRRLGKTNLNVSVLSFGSSPFGNVYGNTTMEQIQRAVDLAVDHGVNLFDSSPYYGLTLAEERLGKALEGKRNKVVLATKCGRYDVTKFDFSRSSVRRSVEDSLLRLRTDHLDLLSAHDIEFVPMRQIVEETVPALRELQREGKVRYVGITGYPVGLLHRLAESVEIDTVLSYCRYSLLNTDMQDVLAPFAEDSRTGLINASPLMMGLLTECGPPHWHPASIALKESAQRAVAAARSQGATITALALQFSLNQNFAASTLIGMATAEEVERNVKAVHQPIDTALLEKVLSAIGNGHSSTWSSGLPENAD
jgi:L-galactose dehydrogenase